MKLDISYAEFSLLRDLVTAEQTKIWKKEWLPRLEKNADPVKAFEKIMVRESACKEKECFWSFLTNKDCCATLLTRFQKAEEGLQKALKEETDGTTNKKDNTKSKRGSREEK